MHQDANSSVVEFSSQRSIPPTKVRAKVLERGISELCCFGYLFQGAEHHYHYRVLVLHGLRKINQSIDTQIDRQTER